MASSFGTLFRVTTWGESHGGAVGAVVDGCPPRLRLAETDIQPFLDRRRPGQSPLTTQRQEEDRVRILSGVFEGRTLGTPILLLVETRKRTRPVRVSFLSRRRATCRTRRAMLAAVREAEFDDWQASGGDYLDSMHQPVT